MRKCKGNVTPFILFCTFGLVVIFLSGVIVKRGAYTTFAQGIQDDLVLSNSTVYKQIDKKSLGENTPLILIKEPVKAYNEIKKHLINNIDLNSDMTAKSDGFFKGNVKVKDFIIYNYKINTVDVITYNESTNTFKTETKDLTKEVVITLNGHKVESTTVTTTLSFDVENFFGKITTQEVSVDTDILRI